MNTKNKYKDNSNRYLLRSLFYELELNPKEYSMYTLKDEDHKGYPSLYKLYMLEEDLTEYNFAKKHLDGLEHWNRLTNCEWFKPIVERWRKELELKVKSNALKNLIEISNDKKEKGCLSANKYLLDNGWKEKPGKGRPSDDDIKKEANRIFKQQSRIKDDMERLGIS